jgi:dienelactone hydrolase
VNSVKQWSSITGFAVILLLSQSSAAQVQPSFPKPSGPFDVGRLEIDLTDASREEVFTAAPADRRRLLVSLYYPAAVPADGKHGAYGTSELAAVWPFFNEERRAWLSPGYAGVPIADGSFPVLVFSPGVGNLTLYYSSLLYEIASRGFVIAALWHPYSTEVVAFPDGTVLRSNPAGGMNGIPPGEQLAKLERLGAVWAADQRFVLDQFAAWNTQHSVLRGHLDLQRVGAFGHSLGGAAAAQAAHVDQRIDAAVNMDGAMFGTVTTEGSRVPFLLLEAERPVLSDGELKQAGMTREQADAWIASLVNVQAATIARSREALSRKLERSKHNTFMTDLLFFTTALPAARRAALVGDMDPLPTFSQISTSIGEFMAAHVQRAK